MDSFLTSCSVESGLVHGIGADEESGSKDLVKDDYNNSGMVTGSGNSFFSCLKTLSANMDGHP